MMSADDNNRAFTELKSALETRNQELGETKEMLVKIESDLDKYEEKNQKLIGDLSEQKNLQKEMKEKIEALEKQLYRMPAGSSKTESTQYVEMKEALNIFFRKDITAKTASDIQLESKYLRTDNDALGGYLTPPEYYMEILKKITEVSPIRQYARKVRTSRESLLVPVRETIAVGNWAGESTEFPSDTSKYGQRELKVNLLSVSSEVTIQMIQDSVFNIEDQITMDIAESFAKTEGAAFVSGNGVTRPEGILTTAGLANGVQVINSGIASSFDADSLINIAGELKTGYDPYYMMNRRTLAVVRRFKDGIGQYLWTPGLANNYPSQINGHGYISAIDVPNVGTDAFAVIFGDFFRGYMIVDHISMFLIRDQFTQSKFGKVVFNALRRVGGMVVLAEAIKVLKCAV